MNIHFQNYDCSLHFDRYAGGAVAIRLHSATVGPIATATVNIPGTVLDKDEVVIKDYSENAGILQSLVEAGVVARTDRTVRAGFALANICKLLIDPGLPE